MFGLGAFSVWHRLSLAQIDLVCKGRRFFFGGFPFVCFFRWSLFEVGSGKSLLFSLFVVGCVRGKLLEECPGGCFGRS